MNTTIECLIMSCIEYTPETGVLKWKYNPERIKLWNTKYAGKIAGSVFTSQHGKQYIRIKIAGYNLLGHRIAWFLMTGTWPPMIDHRDEDGLNNKWNNLRVATQAQNCANSRNGLRGIDPFPNGRWRAKICIDYKQIHLGMFDTKEEAYAAYRRALCETHGDYAIYNRR